MSEISYEKFLPHVLPYVPNCLEDQAVLAIRNACIEFCKETNIVQEPMDAITATAGNNTYQPDVPSGYLMNKVLELYYVGRKMDAKSLLELQRLYTMNWGALVGAPRVYTQFNPDEFTVTPSPAETVKNAFTGRMGLVPTRSSTQVRSIVYDRYLEDIVPGALARLMVTPDQPYTDVAAARDYAVLSKSRIAAVRQYVNSGMTQAPMRARFSRII